jgi:hypothetical protein
LKRLKTSIAAWSALFALAAFAVADFFLSDDGVRNIAYALVTGLTAAGLIRWLPDAARAFRSGRAGAEFLIVGVASMLTILFFHRVWVMTITFYPDLDTPIVTYFVVWMLAWACGLLLVAPDVEDGVIANRSYILIGMALFVAGLVSGLSIAISMVK